MDNNFKGVIWTNHALQRLKERNISQGDAWATFSHPQESKFAQTKGAWVFYRNWDGYQIEVIATQNEKKQWVVLSVWSKEIFNSNKKKFRPLFLENLVEKVLQKLLGRFRKLRWQRHRPKHSVKSNLPRQGINNQNTAYGN